MNNSINNVPTETSATRAARRLGLLLGVMVLVLVLGLASGGSLPAADAAGGPVCYTVADSSHDPDDKNSDFNDVLALVDIETGLATFLGQSVRPVGSPSDVDDVEAAEFDPVGGELFAIDDYRLGTLNQLNAEFTYIGDLGTCNLSGGGSFVIDDADGLAKDFTTGEWYGAARVQVTARDVPDYLFKLQLLSTNPTTPIDPNGFGSGISCVPIPTTGLPGSPDLVDDIGFDPVSGQLYGVANGGASTPTRIIAIDKTDGSVTDLGQAVSEAGAFIPDIEGFSIDETGQWLISTGQDGNAPTDNAIFTIVPPTQPFPKNIPATLRAQLDGLETLFNANDDDYDETLSYEDWEAITCYNVKDVTASLGDYTWIDSNGNGIQDSGEAPAAGVEVTLFGTGDTAIGGGDDWTVGSLDTDASGFYQFPLPVGNYFLEFDPALTYTAKGLGGDSAKDSDATPGTGLTAVTTLTAGENDPTWDAGLLDATVGDFVWLDSDGNGLQGIGEPGIPGIEVKIFDPGPDGEPGGGDDIPIGTTTTDENGMYGFTVLPGDYFIEFDPLQEYTTQNAGDDALDSDPPAGVGTGQTAVFTLAAGDDNTTIDAGLIPATIGDFVWADLDGNGVQNGEPGLAGIQVQLFDPGPDDTPGTIDDNLLATTTTDNNGAYLFYVPPGDYYIGFDPALNFTTPGVGDPTTDSNADANGRSGVVTLAGGEEDITIDAGVVNTATIGDTVWDDVNANGIQDGGETGFLGITVRLRDPGPDGVPGGIDDVTVATTITNGAGYYEFVTVPGDYYLEFVPATSGSFSPADQGGNDATDSDVNVETGRTVVTTLEADETDMDWDAGLYEVDPTKVAIGNIVWHDANDNSVKDAAESGIAGVTVNLYSSGATPGVSAVVATTTTDSSGRYLFPNVTPGTYFVAVDSGDTPLTGTPYSSPGGNHPPDGTGDHPGAGGDDGTPYDSSALPWIITQNFTVAAGGQTTSDIEDPANIADASAYMTIDFGFTATPSAISLGQFGAQAQASIPLALAAAAGLLMAVSVLLIRRSRLANIRA